MATLPDLKALPTPRAVIDEHLDALNSVLAAQVSTFQRDEFHT